jgi:hypothetical protein
MIDDNKKWYQVEGFSTVMFGFNVRAGSEEEAKQLFWKSNVELHEMEPEVWDSNILEVKVCKASDVTHDLTRRLTRGNVSEPAAEPSL